MKWLALKRQVRDLTYERDEALRLVADLRADLEAQQHTIRALMETAPSTIEELP